MRYNGEPGYAWLGNMKDYGRMADAPNFKDHRAKGGNPYLEQTLESYELCCLVETFPNNHESLEDYKITLEVCLFVCKDCYFRTDSLGRKRTVLCSRNRRIGCSMSGIAQFIANKGVGILKDWMDCRLSSHSNIR